MELTSLVDELKIGGSNDEKGYGSFSIQMKLPENICFSAKDRAITPQNTAIEIGLVLYNGKINEKKIIKSMKTAR